MTNPIKHHYVAQMYLRGFAPPPSRKQITIVDKRELKPKTTHPSAICFEEHFFSLTDAEEVGADKFMLEKELSHHEGRVAGILKKIRTAKSFDALCKDDIEFLIGWMAWVFVANSETKDLFASRNKEKLLWTNTQAMAAFIDYHTRILPIFLGRNWQLGVSDYPLITSDRPVTTDIEIRGVRDTSSLSKAIISMPLCPELILVGVPNNDRVFHVMNTRTISETIATIANVGIFLRANRFLIADSSAPFRSLFDKFSSD